ncbi:MAG: hypothetical protein SWH61_12235 [Thermodesulfobacteriota bacterium]|nr:hypothetical protein [Thermodesulfobacteriota bacterium]
MREWFPSVHPTDGKRRILSISELLGMQEGEIATQPVFVFKQKGVDDDGNIFGFFQGAGVKSFFLEHIRTHGVALDPSIFDKTQEV